LRLRSAFLRFLQKFFQKRGIPDFVSYISVCSVEKGVIDVDIRLETEAREWETLASFACRYRISTSVDGLNFTEQAKGVLRVFGAEEIIPFPPHSARYLKLEVLSTTGAESTYPALADARVQIGELTVF